MSLYNPPSTFEVIFAIILIVVGTVAVPLLEIWAINTIFGTGIAYTFWNWLGFYVLNLIVGNLLKS